jgi:hypothetical protein
MMGCSPLPDVPARYALDQLYSLGTLNAEDGSFLFAKIVSETGVVGIFFYIALIWWWIRFERKIRHNCRLTMNYSAAAQTALIFCFVTSSFVRSANYFNGGFLLWIATMAGAAKSQQYLSVQGAEIDSVARNDFEHGAAYGEPSQLQHGP